MLSRRHIATATAALIGAVGLARPTQAALADQDDDFAFLKAKRAQLLAATHEAGQRDPYGREADIQRVVPGDLELVIQSCNGLDRQTRYALIPIDALREDFKTAWFRAMAHVLPPLENADLSAGSMVRFYEDVPPAGWEVVGASESHVILRQKGRLPLADGGIAALLSLDC